MMITDEQQQQDDQPDSAMVLGDDFQTPNVVNVNVTEDLLAAHISPYKKTLFWVPVRVQDRTLCALIDNASSRNLIYKRDYEALPQLPTLRPPRSLLAVGGNNKEIPLLRWSTVRFPISTLSGSHHLCVVKNLSLDLLLGVEFLRKHEWQII